jgi:hypothetical protein
VLASCASPPPPDYTLARDSWNGAAMEDVVRAWGPPNRVDASAPGRESRTWISEVRHPRAYGFSGIGVGVSSGGVGVGVGTGGGMPVGADDIESCERTLVFENERVVDQVWSGSPALCARMTRP